ncbi:putative uncharacterized protein [Clostridium sp. CAG:1013]|nr:putative uncharacterized protein [Clostridium sp. CAG:1013]
MKFILDDLEQPKAERVFVDRVEPRQAFWQAFSAAQQGVEEPMVLHYYGVGGIGKTSLHSQLVKELQERCPTAKYVELDFDFVERREPYRMMGLLKKKLSQTWNFQFPLFDVACYTFLCRIGEDGDQAEIESFVGGSQVLNFLCDAASMIPGTSMISGILKLVDEGVAVVRNLFSNKKQLLRSFESMDIRQLRDQLPIYFASDLRANLKKEKQPFVIFLDTYEKLVNEFAGVGEPLQSDLWLRGPQGLIPRLPNTLWVLGGREKLKWPQLDGPGTWNNVLHQYLLGALADSDAQEFLRSAGVEDPAARERICALSDGLPVSLDLYLEQYLREGTVSDTVAPSTLHERVVRYMSEEEKTACYLLAVLGEWTQDEALAFAQKAGVPLSPTLLERLCGFSFILTQDGVTFHLMRKVGEVLRQYCPTSLSRALAIRKPVAVQKQPAPVLDFASAPKKYVSLTLQTFQEEAACVDWVLDELDNPLMAMRKRLDLDTYFAVIGLLKERAAQSWSGGVLEALVDGYNGVGLYYATYPEQSQKILADALLRMEQLGNFPAMYTVLEQYQYVMFCRMNLTEFVKQAEPLWAMFQQSGNSTYASRTAQLLGEAYELMDLPQEAQTWNQRAPQGESPQSGKTQPMDTRLTQIQKELRERVQTAEFTQEEKDALYALVEEGRQLTLRIYGPESREMFQWYFLEGRIYANTGDYDRGKAVTKELRENSKTYYGETSGTYASFLFLDGFMGYMACCAQAAFSQWPACSAAFAQAYPLLKTNLGSENGFTRQAYTLWKVTDIGNHSLTEYRDQLRNLSEELDNPQDEINAFFLEFLENLEYLPEEVDDFSALEVIVDVFGGETVDPTKGTPPQPQQEEPSPTPEEPEQPESQVTMAQVIQQLMDEYKPVDLYTAFTDIPEKKLRNALKSYGDDPKGELIPYVLALYDATVTGNAKNGFLLFTSGILYRESGSNQGGVTLKDLEPFTTKGKNSLIVNAKDHPELASFVCLKPQNAAQVLNRILEDLKARG